MTESSYTLILTNAERIKLRSLIREEVAALAGVVCTHAECGNFQRAKELAEDRTALVALLDKVRAAETIAEAM